MAPSEFPLGPSRVVAGRNPPPGTDSYADAIRERRGARGITPLDANLLHVPPIAGGYNSLMGAIRTKGKLPGDIREAMILRVAAINHAAFEWIQHEQIGRKEGLSTGQLYVIRDAKTPLPSLPTVLTHLQTAALAYTDHSTRDARVPMSVIQELKKQVKAYVVNGNPSLTAEEVDANVDDLYVEAVMVVASYNMVSRFLLGTDVAGLSDTEVPWPVEKKEHFISLPSFPPSSTPTHTIHAVTLITSPSAPWLVFANSLLTDWTMWSYTIPYFLDLPSSETTSYNILLHSQRGHGLSTLPLPTDHQDRLTTIPLLASDIANLLDALSIPTPVRSVIGVSQGGAVVLAFAAMYADKTRSVVACDTAPRTPVGNKEAWEDRIRLVHGASDSTTASTADTDEYAKRVGMANLAKATVPRWFPPGSQCSTGVAEGEKQARWVEEMVERTDVAGFVHGAKALGDYDVFHLSTDIGVPAQERGGLFNSSIERVLLLAGSLDGGGKVAKGLQDLCTNWNDHLKRGGNTDKSTTDAPTRVQFVEIDSAGHLPMIDSPVTFGKYLTQWVGAF
ncbi:Alpha/Beta hydrolase protein [Flammula alnicola]|nr:Alpha/Beta hydrolase protein [Flammula alnicola]